jgi:hypothetical protein
VENAFGGPKARWRRMKRLDTSDVATGTEWNHACVVSHNFCEVRDDVLSMEEVMEVDRGYELSTSSNRSGGTVKEPREIL